MSTRRKRKAQPTRIEVDDEEQHTPPKRTRRGRAAQEEEEPASQEPASQQTQNDGDDMAFPMSQYTGTLSNDAAARIESKLSPDVLGPLIGNTVRYILFQDTKKLPIKKEDINKKVLSNFKLTGLSSYVLHKARILLSDVFGYQLEDVVVPPVPDDTGAMVARKKPGQFLLVNGLDKKSTLTAAPVAQSRLQALVMVILGVVEIENGRATEDVLWKTLAPMGVRTDRVHPIFGDVKRVVEVLLPRQLYLTRSRMTADNGNHTWVYGRGPRAAVELSLTDPREFVFKVYDQQMDEVEKQKYMELYGPPKPESEGEDWSDVDE